MSGGAALAAAFGVICFALALLVFVFDGGDRLIIGAVLVGLVTDSLAVALVLSAPRRR